MGVSPNTWAFLFILYIYWLEYLVLRWLFRFFSNLYLSTSLRTQNYRRGANDAFPSGDPLFKCSPRLMYTHHTHNNLILMVSPSACFQLSLFRFRVETANGEANLFLSCWMLPPLPDPSIVVAVDVGLDLKAPHEAFPQAMKNVSYESEYGFFFSFSFVIY